MTIGGLSLSLAVVFYAYGVSGTVEAVSQRALGAVLRQGSAWAVPPSGVVLDPQTGLIMPVAFMEDATVDWLRRATPTVRFARVVIGKVVVNGKSVVLYGDERDEGINGLTMARDTLAYLEPGARHLSLGGRSWPVADIRGDLPSGAIFTSLSTARTVLGVDAAIAWLVSDDIISRTAAELLSQGPGIVVTDSPRARVAGVRFAHESERGATICLLETKLARFDPYTFRTKFSAIVLNAAIGTLFGWVARAVFVLGLGLSLSSAMFGVWERRDECALFAVTGVQANVILLFLAEAVLVSGASAMIGAVIAGVLLRLSVTTPDWSATFGGAYGIGFAYVPLLIIGSALLPAHVIASRSAMELVGRRA